MKSSDHDEPRRDTSELSDYALDVLSGVAAQMDMTAYDLICACGRQPGESALCFELRCMSEAKR